MYVVNTVSMDSYGGCVAIHVYHVIWDIRTTRVCSQDVEAGRNNVTIMCSRNHSNRPCFESVETVYITTADVASRI